MAGIIVLLFLVAVTVVFVAKGMRQVPQQQVVVIERLGKFHKTLGSGLNWIIPFFDSPRAITWKDGRETKFIDLREIPYDIPQQMVITKDNVQVGIDGLIYFQITDAKRALYEITNLYLAIEKLAQTSLRSLVGSMDLDETLSGRDKINSALTKIMDDATDKWGVKVHRVEIQRIDPPQEIRTTMEKQMTAERNRRAMITEAEGKKTADITTSEGEMQKNINLAEGRKQAAIREAEGQKMALELKGAGEKAFIERVKEGVGNANLVQYLLGLKYIERIPEMFNGNNKVVVPYEAMSLMGALKTFQTLAEKSKEQEA